MRVLISILYCNDSSINASDASRSMGVMMTEPFYLSKHERNSIIEASGYKGNSAFPRSITLCHLQLRLLQHRQLPKRRSSTAPISSHNNRPRLLRRWLQLPFLAQFARSAVLKAIRNVLPKDREEFECTSK